MIEYTRCTAGRKARWSFRWCGSEVEQLTRNEQAVGSIPTTSSKNPLFSRKQRVFCMQKGKNLPQPTFPSAPFPPSSAACSLSRPAAFSAWTRAQIPPSATATWKWPAKSWASLEGYTHTPPDRSAREGRTFPKRISKNAEKTQNCGCMKPAAKRVSRTQGQSSVFNVRF